MKSVFNEVKATQLAALVLQFRGGTTNLLDLMKILYLVDREAFIAFHRPFTGDRYVSMKFGMVLSSTYDLIKGQKSFPPRFWSKYIERIASSNKITLKANPGVDEFSQAELTLVKGLVEKYARMSTNELVDDTHHKELPEWVMPQEPAKSVPISHEEMLQKVGVEKEEINRISHNAEIRTMFESLI